ncbi:hypothetical protein QCA50_011161 [Cerrena zonata]|uniref:DDE Tnp4 domain-containing protein n=1 Tax=Cerrena zonata TaxID=2478898 RepID=A0AAW0FX79_9APHY
MTQGTRNIQVELVNRLEEEDEIDDELQDQYTLAATIAGIGSIEAHRSRVEARAQHRGYLLRSDLLPNPRTITPWQRLRDGRSDHAYIVTMGLDVKTFELILSSGFQRRWEESTIDRTDVSSVGAPRPERRSLDAAGALGLVLHWLCSTMREISLQQIFALIPSTVNRYLAFSLRILLETLKELPQASISWPDQVNEHNEFEKLSEIVTSRHSLLKGAFGSIDGLNLPCQVSDDVEIENATYNGWLHGHFISSVFVFGARGTLIGGHFNCPGSWHDSRVAMPIYNRLRDRTPNGYYLVADTAFPRGTASVEGRIRAPIKAGQKLPHDPTGPSVLRSRLERVG